MGRDGGDGKASSPGTLIREGKEKPYRKGRQGRKGTDKAIPQRPLRNPIIKTFRFGFLSLLVFF
jgi:hypothetical protein